MMPQIKNSMLQAKAQDILRRIIPWALEANSLKPKCRCNYKGVRGRVGIVGGARDYAGAPYFASISAMKLGADLAYVICSEAASPAIKSYSPDLIVSPILDSAEPDFHKEIDCLLKKLHALVIGPGLGRDKFLQSRAKILIQEARARSIPLVLDADSLILVNEDPTIVRSYPKAILTPNRFELQRMLESMYAPERYDLGDLNTKEIESLVKKYSKDMGVMILAKGVADICCHPSGFTLITDELLGSNRRCGGQGDILAGLASVYMHWIQQAIDNKTLEDVEYPMVWASYLAAVTTRQSNELAYKEHKTGMLASNMLDKLNVSLENLLKDIKNCPQKITAKLNYANYVGSLSQDELSRYNRQMIMDEFGPERQLNLKKSSVIIIGAGGLGCPAAVYLGAGGIGRIGLVDHDTVEASNLHRQILHNLSKVGMLKTESIKQSILAINPSVEVDTHSVKLSSSNAVELIEKYDIVIDATDNLLTRYMINDACVVAKKPLVSGAALKMDGQLTVYNYDQDTPCFRCLFPDPPPMGAVGSCSDNGVLGVIPGIIGVHQALEAIKIAAGMRPAYAGKMLIFDGQQGIFRQVSLNKRRADCKSCGWDSKLSRELIDYEAFCGQGEGCEVNHKRNDLLTPEERISTEEYSEVLRSNQSHILVDVRPKVHSDLSRFEHAIQMPVEMMLREPEKCQSQLKARLAEICTSGSGGKVIYVVCRRGIASQRGARIVEDLVKELEPKVVVKDIVGGMTAWSKSVDPSFSCL